MQISMIGHLSRRTFACLVWKSSNWIKALGQRSFTAAMNSSDDHVDHCNGDKTVDNYHDGDDGYDGDGDGDGDGDIYIMMKCLSVCL